jgi:phasin family protein
MNKETYTNPFWGDNVKGLKDIKFPWFDSELMLSNYRRNMNLINTTQQIAAETTKAVIQLQAQYMKDVFEQLSEQTKQNISTFSPEERVAYQSEKTKAAVDQAVDHARNVNTLISKSNEKIIENVQKRFNEGVDESASLAKKTKTK